MAVSEREIKIWKCLLRQYGVNNIEDEVVVQVADFRKVLTAELGV